MKIEGYCRATESVTISSGSRTHQHDALALLKNFLEQPPCMGFICTTFIKFLCVVGVGQIRVKVFDSYPQVVIYAQRSSECEQATPRTSKICIWTISCNYCGDIFHV